MPLQAYAVTARDQWVTDWPGQVILCVSQIYWTVQVHEAIRTGICVPCLLVLCCLYIVVFTS